MTPITAAPTHDGAGAAPGTVTVVEPSAAVPVGSRDESGDDSGGGRAGKGTR